MARSTARKRALNTLYEADEKGQDILSLLAERLDHPGAQTPLPGYAVTIVQGVAAHAHAIDRLLNDHSTGWRVPRMAVVDRNILRLAVWEIVYNDEVPDGVAIDEALTLAKTLSDEDSPAFIHGLLNAVASDADARAKACQGDEPTESENQGSGGHEDSEAIGSEAVASEADVSVDDASVDESSAGSPTANPTQAASESSAVPESPTSAEEPETEDSVASAPAAASDQERS